jgi:hypothetical protein
MVRGGSWSYGYTPIENTTRRDYVPQYVDDDTGFRIATQISPYAVSQSTTGLVSQYALNGHEQISMLYLSLLGRPADDQGYQFWLNALGARPSDDALLGWTSIADEIGASAEAQQRYAALADPQNATELEIGEFLGDVYQSLFSREADAQGLQWWTDVFEQEAETGLVGSVVVDMAAATYLNMALANDHIMLAYNASSMIPEAFPG